MCLHSPSHPDVCKEPFPPLLHHCRNAGKSIIDFTTALTADPLLICPLQDWRHDHFSFTLNSFFEKTLNPWQISQKLFFRESFNTSSYQSRSEKHIFRWILPVESSLKSNPSSPVLIYWGKYRLIQRICFPFRITFRASPQEREHESDFS